MTLAISMVIYVAVCATALAVVGADAFSAATTDAAAPLEVVARSFEKPAVALVVALGAITAGDTTHAGARAHRVRAWAGGHRHL